MHRRLTFKTVDGPWITVDHDDIVRISAANKHTCIVLRDASHLVRPLLEIAARLDDRFVRVHRGEVNNLAFVVSVDPPGHGDAVLALDDGSRVLLTRTYRDPFFARFRR